ncbi:MAG: DUF3310 domain-containing protein [Cohaesibacteraceae bacterium]|nr:DUF3310 domain-containing protein [Cohaesibacteraceae bacterium]MBL4876198.1 DUF3310 domain-containing protein [Cohaesibacteraceae bacterium]
MDTNEVGTNLNEFEFNLGDEFIVTDSDVSWWTVGKTYVVERCHRGELAIRGDGNAADVYRQGAFTCANFIRKPQASPKDPVNSPSHYTSGSIETIDVIEQVCALYPGNEACNIGNVIKYVSRAPLKGNKLQDLQKARNYLNRVVGHLEGLEGAGGTA